MPAVISGDQGQSRKVEITNRGLSVSLWITLRCPVCSCGLSLYSCEANSLKLPKFFKIIFFFNRWGTFSYFTHLSVFLDFFKEHYTLIVQPKQDDITRLSTFIHPLLPGGLSQCPLKCAYQWSASQLFTTLSRLAKVSKQNRIQLTSQINVFWPRFYYTADKNVGFFGGLSSKLFFFSHFTHKCCMWDLR